MVSLIIYKKPFYIFLNHKNYKSHNNIKKKNRKFLKMFIHFLKKKKKKKKKKKQLYTMDVLISNFDEERCKIRYLMWIAKHL